MYITRHFAVVLSGPVLLYVVPVMVYAEPPASVPDAEAVEVIKTVNSTYSKLNSYYFDRSCSLEERHGNGERRTIVDVRFITATEDAVGSDSATLRGLLPLNPKRLRLEMETSGQHICLAANAKSASFYRSNDATYKKGDSLSDVIKPIGSATFIGCHMFPFTAIHNCKLAAGVPLEHADHQMDNRRAECYVVTANVPTPDVGRPIDTPDINTSFVGICPHATMLQSLAGKPETALYVPRPRKTDAGPAHTRLKAWIDKRTYVVVRVEAVSSEIHKADGQEVSLTVIDNFSIADINGNVPVELFRHSPRPVPN